MANYEKPQPNLIATDDEKDVRVVFYYKNDVPHVGVGGDEYPVSMVGYSGAETTQLKALVFKAISFRLADQGYSEV